MTYEDVIAQIVLDGAIRAFERTGNIGPDLQPYWEAYQKMNPAAEPGPEFAQEVRKIWQQKEQAGAGEYSAAPIQAGAGKWPFAGRKPEGGDAASMFTNAIKRMTGE